MIVFSLITVSTGTVWATVSVRADGWRAAGRMLALTYPGMIVALA
jgi:hypothetical protein